MDISSVLNMEPRQGRLAGKTDVSGFKSDAIDDDFWLSNILVSLRNSGSSDENGGSLKSSSESEDSGPDVKNRIVNKRRKKRTYSTDITYEEREKIIRAVVEDGTAYRTVAKMYGRNHSTVFRIVKRYKQTGEISNADSMRGRKKRILNDAQWRWISSFTGDNDVHIGSLKTIIFEKFGVMLSEPVISRNLERFNENAG